MNQTNFGTRLLARLAFGAVGLIIVFVVRSGLFQGDCNDAAVDKYIESVDAITAKSDKVFDAMTADNEANTLSTHAGLVEDASNLEHPGCLDATHSEVMLAMQSWQEALEYAYDDDITRADQALEEAEGHLDKANEAIPNP